MKIPVVAYLTAALTTVAWAPFARSIPPQSPGAGLGQPGTRARGHATPAVPSAKLVKTFWLLLPVSPARKLPPLRLIVPLLILTTSPAFTVSVPDILRSPSRM